MDKQTLYQALDNIGRQNMPDEMDILPDIQVKSRKITFMGDLYGGRIAASLIVGLLFVATTVYAVTQLGINDPALQSSMVTELGISQTVGDTSITLDWAYADANRVVVGYSVTEDESALEEDWFPDLRLTDSEGRAYRPVIGFGANWLTSQEMTSGAYFDANVVEDAPVALDLQLRIEESFVFDFTVPFIVGVHIDAHAPVESAGLAVNLEWAVIAPSMTRTYICYEMPDGMEWANSGANVDLYFDGERVAVENSSRYPIARHTLNDGRRCQEDLFLASYVELPQEVTATVTSLHTQHRYSRENMQRAADVYAEYSIEAEVIRNEAQTEESYLLNFPNPPIDPQLFERVSEEAYANMGEPLAGETIEGLWELHAELP